MGRHIYYQCQRCTQIRCRACETLAPEGEHSEIKTEVRWCGSEACIADEATANGVSVEAMKAHKRRVQSAWRRDVGCLESPHRTDCDKQTDPAFPCNCQRSGR